MPPKNKKSKAEEALAFLDNLDNLDNLEPPPASSESAPIADARPSTDSAKRDTEVTDDTAPDEEAADALAFLEAQIKQKRAPLSVPGPSTSTPRTGSPALSAPSVSTAATGAAASPVAAPAAASAAPAASGWGVSSFWSSATTALQSAQRVADEQYKKVRAEGVSGVAGQLDHLNVGGVDLGKLRKDAEERLGGIVKGVGSVDLDRLRNDLLSQANSTLTNFINTVAPPISAHETIELWLTHPMVGYDGVEGVVYRAWTSILEQTESGELVVVWSRPETEQSSERGLYPVQGWDEGWKAAQAEIEAVKAREDKNPRGRTEASADVPVTTIPVFLQLQPLLAPLPVPEPPLLLSSTEASAPTQQLYFIITLQDPSHGLRFSTVSQPVPADWLEVEYEKSDWVEERLVDVLRTSVEVLAQDYVSTRMGLKPSALALAAAAKETVSGAEAPKADEAKKAA